MTEVEMTSLETKKSIETFVFVEKDSGCLEMTSIVNDTTNAIVNDYEFVDINEAEGVASKSRAKSYNLKKISKYVKKRLSFFEQKKQDILGPNEWFEPTI